MHVTCEAKVMAASARQLHRNIEGWTPDLRRRNEGCVEDISFIYVERIQVFYMEVEANL